MFVLIHIDNLANCARLELQSFHTITFTPI